jgi:hypothetical protein
MVSYFEDRILPTLVPAAPSPQALVALCWRFEPKRAAALPVRGAAEAPAPASR